MAAFAAVLGILTVLSSLRYHFAIPLPEDENDAAAIAVLCTSLVTLSTVVVAVVAWQFSEGIASLLRLPDLASYLWLLPCALFFAGFYQILNLWAIREGAFKSIAKTKFNQGLGMTIVQVLAFPLGPVGLLLGKAVQQGIGVGTLGALTLKRRWPSIQRTGYRDTLAVASTYKNFPLYSLWGGAANKVGSEIPALAFVIFFGPVLAGLYALANRVCALPMSLIGRAVADAFYSDAAQKAKTGDLGLLVQGVHERLARIALPPALTLFIVGPDLFEVVFGSQWREAGVIARWLAPMLYAQFAVAPLIRTLMAIGLQAVDTGLQILMVLVRTMAIAVGVYFQNFYVALIALSISSAFVYMLYQIVIFIHCDVSIMRALKPTGKASFLGAAFNVPVILAVSIGVKPIGICATAILSGSIMAFYYLYLLRTPDPR